MFEFGAKNYIAVVGASVVSAVYLPSHIFSSGSNENKGEGRERQRERERETTEDLREEREGKMHFCHRLVMPFPFWVCISPSNRSKKAPQLLERKLVPV